jgi:hypothetical protein
MDQQEWKAKFAEPQLPPASGETEIHDYFRIVWLVRSYMSRVAFPPVGVPGTVKMPSETENLVEFYAAPDGSCWRMADVKTGGLSLRRVA